LSNVAWLASGFTTRTSTRAGKWAGAVQRICPLVWTTTSVAGTPPNSTVAPTWNCEPDRVTRRPPSLEPWFGDTEVRLGAALTSTLCGAAALP
jgi:hypothetical protein